MTFKSETPEKRVKNITRRRTLFRTKVLLKKIGMGLLWTFLLLLLLFGALEGWMRINRAYDSIAETKYAESQLLKENALLRKSALESCISENTIRNYLLLDERNCATFFPELIEENDASYTLDHEFLAFFQRYFLSKEPLPSPLPTPSEPTKIEPVAKNEKKEPMNLDQLLENPSLLQYLSDLSFSLEKSEKDGTVLLKKEKTLLATLSYNAEKNEVFAMLPGEKQEISVSTFTKTFGNRDPESSLSKADIDAIRNVKSDTAPRENILVLGKNNGNVDTIIFASFDSVHKKITLVSIPRDLWVDARKINSWYNAYGIDAFTEEIEILLGQKIAHYVMIDMEAFPTVIDAIGGISYTFDAPLIDPSYRTVDEGKEGTLYFPTGTAYLSGIQALRIARTRHTTSDFSRAARQQELLMAAREKVNSFYKQNPTSLPRIITILLKNVKTDMTVGEILALYLSAKDHTVQKGNVMSTGNILASEMLDIGNGKRTYALLPKDKDWDILKKFVWAAILK